MTFYDMLKSDVKIRIEDRRGRGYEPCVFYMDDGQLISKSPTMGRIARDDMSAARFNEHIINMIANSFTIIID